MAIDETLSAKKVAAEVKEMEEQLQQKPEELPELEEKPSTLNNFPFNLEELEDRITKKVQTQCREECQNFLNEYFKQRMTGQSSNVVHSTFSCSGCSIDPIVGIRYQCTVRKDYNLCERCEDELQPQPYPLIKIRNPVEHMEEVQKAKPLVVKATA